jgi:threonine/homoserine/homoserine lactone efflux protein
MLNLIFISLPILLTDIVNPVLLAAVIFAMGSRRPFINSWLILAGWLVIYFSSGILLAMGLETIMTFLKNPRPVDFYIQLVVAALLIWFGVKLVRDNNPRNKQADYGEAGELSAGKAFILGAMINLIGLPFAIPYFAFLDQIVKSDLTWIPALTVLLIYNLLYILPFSLLMLIRLIYKEQSDSIFAKINERMEKVGNVVMPLIIFAIAGILIVDSYLYFTTGTPLILL